MQLRTLHEDERPQVIALLSEAALPVADLDQAHVHFIVAARDGEPLAGVVGLQTFESVGLVRSLAVRANARKRGLGERLIQALETHASAQGLRELVLLTETAEPFFAQRGYRRIDRDAAPPGVRTCAEFRSLCPASATCMLKRLDSSPT